MKKILIYIGLFVLFSILLIGCTINDNIIPSINNQNAIFQECQFKQNVNSQAIVGDVYKIDKGCLFNKANDSETCKSYLGQKIYEWSDKIINFEYSDVDQCINLLAIRNNDTSICDQANTLVHNCYKTIALNTKSPELCKKFSDITLECYGALAGSEQCKEKANNYLVGIIPCIYNNLHIKKEEINLNDTTICSFLENFQNFPDNDKLCIAGIGAYLNDTSICDKAGNYKGDCWIVIARNNPSFTLKDCDKAGTDYIGCYVAVAVAKGDSSICLSLPQGHKTDCLRQIALKTNNIDVCLNIDEPQYTKECVQKILIAIGEDNYTLHICDIMTQFDNLNSNQCYYNIGLKNLDLNACNKIQGENTVKNECTTRVQHALVNK